MTEQNKTIPITEAQRADAPAAVNPASRQQSQGGEKTDAKPNEQQKQALGFE
jgi:hypothetical protein